MPWKLRKQFYPLFRTYTRQIHAVLLPSREMRKCVRLLKLARVDPVKKRVLLLFAICGSVPLKYRSNIKLHIAVHRYKNYESEIVFLFLQVNCHFRIYFGFIE